MGPRVNLQDLLRRLPSVDRLAGHPALRGGEGTPVQSVLVRAARETLDEARAGIRAAMTNGGGGEEGPAVPSLEELAGRARERARLLARPRLRRVVNATGIVVHTNLGRSLLSPRAVRALVEAATSYVSLEMDLETGERSSRQDVVADLLCQLTGAEAALVVNNNAAAVFLALETLARGRGAVISRGELVEIGGSFRLPDVMAKSGARMVEVGTTNRTRPGDYQAAIDEETALLVKVHRSNFAVQGFTQEVPVADLAALGRPHGVPVLYDLGSGVLVDLARAGRVHEPTPQEALAAGAALVTMSGDKLLGGPQAGIILGERGLVNRIARNPLARVLRVEKLVLAALEATLAEYRDGGDDVFREIPTLAMIAAGEETLRKRARTLVRRLSGSLSGLAKVTVEQGESEAGGGSLPGVALPTPLVAVRMERGSAAALAAALRRGEPPVIARIREEALLLDPRTLSTDDERDLVPCMVKAAREAVGEGA